MKIPVHKIDPNADPWGHIKGPALPLLEKPCADCAVTCGFYMEFTEKLKLEPKEKQEHIARRWDCHNNPGRACRGNWNALGLGKSK
jgi:hypothetical protein